jgi:uncharacterized membrane protein
MWKVAKDHHSVADAVIKVPPYTTASIHSILAQASNNRGMVNALNSTASR